MTINVHTGIRIRPLGISWLHWSSYCIGNFLDKVRIRITGGKKKEQDINRSDNQEPRRQSKRDRSLSKYNKSDVRRVQEAQNKVNARKLELENLMREVQESVLEQFDKTGGHINYIPCDLGEVINLSDGWDAKLIHQDDEEDIFLCTVEKGASIAEHNHFQIELFMSIYGSSVCSYQSEVNGNMKSQKLKALEVKQIESNCNHSFVATSKGKNIVIFQPGITKPKA